MEFTFIFVKLRSFRTMLLLLSENGFSLRLLQVGQMQRMRKHSLALYDRVA